MTRVSDNPGLGKAVVTYLKEPRERNWGILLSLDSSGAWIRGIEVDAFEDWARAIAAGRNDVAGESTFFIPHLRIQKIVIDEDYPAIPSLSSRLKEITGKSAENLLLESE